MCVTCTVMVLFFPNNKIDRERRKRIDRKTRAYIAKRTWAENPDSV